mgnify:CR=1 FL=1
MRIVYLWNIIRSKIITLACIFAFASHKGELFLRMVELMRLTRNNCQVLTHSFYKVQEASFVVEACFGSRDKGRCHTVSAETSLSHQDLSTYGPWKAGDHTPSPPGGSCQPKVRGRGGGADGDGWLLGRAMQGARRGQGDARRGGGVIR